MDSAWREDYFNFGGTMKAYFCNKPRQKLSIPKNEFVHDEIKRINQKHSRINHSPKPVKAKTVLSESNKLRKREADDKYFLPKEEVDLKAKKDFSRNIENLNKIFSKTNIDEKWDNSDEDTKYFDSLNTFGDNEDYIQKLQQDIGNLRREYAANSRMSPNIRHQRKERPDTTVGSREVKKLDYMRGERSEEVETLVRRSFWEDLARVKERMLRSSGREADRERERERRLAEEAEVRDSWYRTSRRFSDSRVRRSIKKKNRDAQAQVKKIKSSSWSHNPKVRKDLQIKINSKKAPPSHSISHYKDRYEGDTGATLSKDVYKEILDIVNVNSPNTLPFGKARMANWVLSSKPYSEEL